MSQEMTSEAGDFEQAVDTNTLFSILSSERRRYALYCLQQYRNPMTLADLADEVARLETGEETVAAIPAEDVKTVYMMLYHTHIPKLADANIVDYDQDTDTVRLNYEFATLDLEDLV